MPGAGAAGRGVDGRRDSTSAMARPTAARTMTAATVPRDARPRLSMKWPPTAAPRPMPMLAPEMS